MVLLGAKWPYIILEVMLGLALEHWKGIKPPYGPLKGVNGSKLGFYGRKLPHIHSLYVLVV